MRNSKKKSFLPVTGLRNRWPLKDFNDSKLIVYKSKWFPWSSRINSTPFRIFRGPLFYKPETGQELFCCFLQQTGSTSLWPLKQLKLWEPKLGRLKPNSSSVQLNEYEADWYFLQNFQCMKLLIHRFCKICEHEIVLQGGKSKQKQFQVYNSYKTRE